MWTEKLVYVNLPYACYGLTIRQCPEGWCVVDTPPIAAWMKWKWWDYCSKWIEKKGGTWELVS